MSAKKSLELSDDHTEANLNMFNHDNTLFYEKIFDSLNAIVFVFDMHKLKMVWVNDGFKKILGYEKTTRKIPKSVLIDIYHPDDRDMLKEMRTYFKENLDGTFTAIFQFRDVNEKYIWLCTAANVFRRIEEDSVFEIVGVSINFSNDITYDKNLKVITQQKTILESYDLVKSLTRRELQLIRMFASGSTTKDIAVLLDLSFHTVNNHRKNILKKLGLPNVAAMATFAVENGLS